LDEKLDYTLINICLPCLHPGQHEPSAVYISSPSPQTGNEQSSRLQSEYVYVCNYTT